MPTSRDAELAKQLWAVGDPVRLRILRLLPQMADCQHESNVSSLAVKLGLSQPTVSHHLRVLRQAGLVSYRKMCRDVFYWIEPKAAGAMLRTMEQVFAGEAGGKAPKRRAKKA
jgi:ArsR family transcriptional regulator